MVSKRWGNGYTPVRSLPPSRVAAPAPVPTVQRETPMWERPAVMVGAALATGFVLGLIVKWRLRR